VVYEVSGNETFIAWKNGGAWLNGEKINVSKATKLSDSLIATGFPYSDFNLLEQYMNCLSHFCKHTHGIRRLGSAAIDLAYVACGRFEGCYEYGLHQWDIAAGIILVREAGGLLSDLAGNELKLSGQEIIASNCFIYPELLEIVDKYMNHNPLN